MLCIIGTPLIRYNSLNDSVNAAEDCLIAEYAVVQALNALTGLTDDSNRSSAGTYCRPCRFISFPIMFNLYFLQFFISLIIRNRIRS